MASWQPIADGPYDWRIEGPLAYYYHVAYDLGLDWLSAPLPPPYTLERWLRHDADAFQVYWPHWYEIAKSGRWDDLYPPEPPDEHTTPVYVGPYLPPVTGLPQETPDPENRMPELSLSDLELAQENALRRVTGRERDPLASPVDGSNDLPAWLRTIEQISVVAARGLSLFGLGAAEKKQETQARRVTGGDQRPTSAPPTELGALTLGGLSVGTILLIALVVWLLRK